LREPHHIYVDNAIFPDRTRGRNRLGHGNMQKRSQLITEEDLHRIFRATPHPYLALTPQFTIVAANEAYLDSTYTDFALIEGRYMFEVFPDNPAFPYADGVSNLSASLRHVAEFREPHHMAIQRYDIRFRDNTFVERHWRPANFPIFGGRGHVVYILHHVEDVTREAQAVQRPPGHAHGDYVAMAEICAERAKRSVWPSDCELWLDLERQWRELKAFRKRV
jgi:PAS domain-containing protein